MAIIIPESRLATTELQPIMSPSFRAPDPIRNPLKPITDVINRAVREEIDETNKIKVNDAINSLQSGLQERGYGNGKERGFYSLQGINAVNGQQRFNDGNELLAESISEDLNDTQRRMFSKYSADILLKSSGSTLEFVNGQRHVAKVSSLEGQKVNAINGVALDYTESGRQINYTSGRVAVFEGMSQQGADPQATRQALSDFDSKFYYNAIKSALANGDMEQAASMLATYGDKITPVKRASLRGSLATDSAGKKEDYDLQIAQYTYDVRFDPEGSLTANLEQSIGLSPEVRKLYEGMVRRGKKDHVLNKAYVSEELVNQYSGTPVSSIPSVDKSKLLPADKKRLYDIEAFESGLNDADIMRSLAQLNNKQVANINLSDAIKVAGYAVSSAGYKKAVEYKKKRMDGLQSERADALQKAMTLFPKVIASSKVLAPFGELGLKKDSIEYNNAYLNIQLLATKFINQEIDKKEAKGESQILSNVEITNIINRASYSGTIRQEGWFTDSDVDLGIPDIAYPVLAAALPEMKKSHFKKKPGETDVQHILRFLATHSVVNGLDVDELFLERD